MAKFGELITKKLALIFFYDEYNGNKEIFSDAVSQVSNASELNPIALDFF